MDRVIGEPGQTGPICQSCRDKDNKIKELEAEVMSFKNCKTCGQMPEICMCCDEDYSKWKKGRADGQRR